MAFALLVSLLRPAQGLGIIVCFAFGTVKCVFLSVQELMRVASQQHQDQIRESALGR